MCTTNLWWKSECKESCRGINLVCAPISCCLEPSVDPIGCGVDAPNRTNHAVGQGRAITVAKAQRHLSVAIVALLCVLLRPVAARQPHTRFSCELCTKLRHARWKRDHTHRYVARARLHIAGTFGSIFQLLSQVVAEGPVVAGHTYLAKQTIVAVADHLGAIWLYCRLGQASVLVHRRALRRCKLRWSCVHV